MGCVALVQCVLVLHCGLAGVVLLCCGLAGMVWCDIRMQAEALVLQPAPPTPTHTEPEQHNPCNNSTNKSQAPEDGCINI